MAKNASAKIKFLFLFLLFSTIFSASAQRPFGNEWVQYDQSYYKIKIAKDGIYRLDYNTLKSAGVNVDSLEAQTLQIFYRGKQIPIFVAGESDNVFNSTDYIEFYGQHNDGALDSVFFANPKDQSHTYYSTYTDTSVYFLTWGYWDEPLRIKDFNYVSGLDNSKNTIIGESVRFFKDIYQDGAQIDAANNFYTPEYTLNEGWQSADIRLGRFSDVSLITGNADINSYTKPVLEFRINSRSDYTGNVGDDHHLLVEIKAENGTFRKVYEDIYDGFKAHIKSIPVEWSDIGPKTIVRVSSKGIAGVPTDIHTISYIRIKYPKKLNTSLQLDTVFTQSGTGTDTFNNFNMFTAGNANAVNYILFDIVNGFRALPNIAGDSIQFTIKKQGAAKYFLYDKTKYKSANLSAHTFIQMDLSLDYNYLIVTHKLYWQAAKDFASYKETKQIDSFTKFKTYIADVEYLYDEFFYGSKSPAAIQNFFSYVYHKQAQKPKYALLFGKGYEVKDARRYQKRDYVPTIGQPASELMYVSGIDNNFSGYDLTLNPNIALGRLAARTADSMYIYLDKLKEYDSAPAALWKKEFVHVGGGQDLNLQNISQNILNNVKAIAEGPYLGAKVHSYFAQTSDVVNKDKKAAIQARMDRGLGMLTYFGHAAGDQLGVEFANPNTLKNAGKYPIFYLNGCNVGNPALMNIVQMDQYLFGKEKGTVSWISHTNTTYTGTLENQMKAFYSLMAQNKNYFRVGDAWKECLNIISISPTDRAAAYAWIIQGDPSMDFPFLHIPDYAVTGNIKISPEDVVATSERFELNIPLANLGRTDTQQITVSVKHTFPDGKTHIYDKLKIVPPFFADTITFVIKNNVGSLQGQNKFDIYVDADSTVKEANEQNNAAHFEFYFPGSGVRSLFPLNYAIVPSIYPELVAQSRDLFDTTTEMYFEIDTTPYFNSPFIKRSSLLKGNNIVKWIPSISTKDSTVYYWRARLNLPIDSGGFWETRSFTYIKNSTEGWSQSHFPQYAGIKTQGVLSDTTARQFKFMPKYKGYTATMNAFIPNGMGIKPNDDLILNYCINNSTILFIEFDRKTLALVDTIIECNMPQFHQKFKMTEPQERQRFIREVDSIKDGNYVALISIGKLQEFNEWEPEVYQAFDKLGSTMIRNFKRDSVGFVLAGIKYSDKGTLIKEDFKYDSIANPNTGDTARIEFFLEAIGNNNGFITSEPIGRASK